jgi:drug/metabolite transporter (DMT)-like permease
MSNKENRPKPERGVIPENRKKLIGSLCIIGTTVCYGLIPSLSFLSFDAGVATETLLFDKFFYAAMLMWAYIFIKKIPFKPDREAAPMLIIICISYIGIATTLYLSFDYISGSLATIISFTFPAMIIAIEMITGMEPVRFVKITAVVLSMLGLVLIVWTPHIRGNLTGIFFAFLTAVCYVIYIMGLSSKKIKKLNSITVAGYVLLSSAVFNMIRCALSGNPMFTRGTEQLVFMLLLAVICAFAAILLYCIGVKLLGAGNAAIINTFEPVLACIFGYFLIGDVLTRNMIIGSAMVVMAVFIANLPKKGYELKPGA